MKLSAPQTLQSITVEVAETAQRSQRGSFSACSCDLLCALWGYP